MVKQTVYFFYEMSVPLVYDNIHDYQQCKLVNDNGRCEFQPFKLIYLISMKKNVYSEAEVQNVTLFRCNAALNK